jgi:7-carboxy-7-deazaguanine synthase
MPYLVKEIFYTLQGEGVNTGRPSVFCRFSGCNLWSGREEDRARSVCSFCDTDFSGTDGVNGGTYETPEDLARAISRLFPQAPSASAKPFLVCTGGEPLLQLDEALVKALHRLHFEVAVETNGTIPPPPGLDWITVSPKAGTILKAKSGDELKLVFPQVGMDPALYEDLHFRHFLVQPMDGPDMNRNRGLAVDYCLCNPRWRLSLQTHKYLGIP